MDKYDEKYKIELINDIEVDIIVKTAVNNGTYCKFASRINIFQSLSKNMRAGMAVNFKPFFVL